MEQEDYDITEFKEDYQQFLELKEDTTQIYECIKHYCEGTNLFNRLNEERLFQFLYPYEIEPQIEFEN